MDSVTKASNLQPFDSVFDRICCNSLCRARCLIPASYPEFVRAINESKYWSMRANIEALAGFMRFIAGLTSLKVFFFFADKEFPANFFSKWTRHKRLVRQILISSRTDGMDLQVPQQCMIKKYLNIYVAHPLANILAWLKWTHCRCAGLSPIWSKIAECSKQSILF